ncbi:phosphatidylinositol-3,5-bisphosphate 3-phosphatase MTMR8-like [Apostichopus japonicus]|uniref:phosphatidylinositol-3,5-bisphosphate 3-phosphatase MTMR8-like n=1 Tax=Stichopus japonicus TaxID=307972 RepID=UPI003AB1DED5
MEFITRPKIENVRLLNRFNSKKPSIGTLYLTATHLIFSDPAGKREPWILHQHISALEKQPLTTTGAPLLIRCKTFQTVTFVIPKEKDCQELYKSLQKLSNPEDLTDMYAFTYKSASLSPSVTAGWDQFDLHTEYARMGIPNGFWKASAVNRDYEVCPTYPRMIHVPAASQSSVLFGSAKFRSRGRLPVLSYLHHNMAAMCRCSQPLAGFSARCMEDEQMLQDILLANKDSSFMYVVDTRPRINAMVNRASGKGYENEDFYTNIKFKFIGIENIHVMRNSLQKLLEVCELKNPSMENFLSGIDSSNWLRHIKAVLDTSYFIAKVVSDGVSVLVHCSDGWDRTAQTCSLASMMLDPYYRTLKGLEVLIEKEWLAFGHKFIHRCGLINVDPREVSPIFTQFIDCVWQLTQLYPCAFQFNERFLLELHDHVYSCQFGNFLGNCEKDRLGMKLPERTYSLWSFMRTRMTDYINPLYLPNHTITKGVILPDFDAQRIKFWRGMYNRYENGVHPREPVSEVLCAVKDHTVSLKDNIVFLETKLATLKRILGKAETPPADESDSPSNSLENHENDLESRDKLKLDRKSKRRPILIKDDSFDIISSTLLTDAADSVAVDWMSFRNIKQCVCDYPFEHFSRKYHCWRCGVVYCIRCIDKQTPLPGHDSQRPVPVCKGCYKILKAGSSEPATPSRSPSKDPPLNILNSRMGEVSPTQLAHSIQDLEVQLAE